MIAITASGFIAAKPELQLLSRENCKCEFRVLSTRRVKSKDSGEWQSVFESAAFVAWGEDARRVAESLDKGSNVNCTGIQETSSWTKPGGEVAYSTKYRLTHFTKVYTPKRDASEPRGSSQPPRRSETPPRQPEFEAGDERDHSSYEHEHSSGTAKPADQQYLSM
jgi:single-stranded DNA-binding protein